MKFASCKKFLHRMLIHSKPLPFHIVDISHLQELVLSQSEGNILAMDQTNMKCLPEMELEVGAPGCQVPCLGVLVLVLVLVVYSCM